MLLRNITPPPIWKYIVALALLKNMFWMNGHVWWLNLFAYLTDRDLFISKVYQSQSRNSGKKFRSQTNPLTKKLLWSAALRASVNFTISPKSDRVSFGGGVVVVRCVWDRNFATIFCNLIYKSYFSDLIQQKSRQQNYNFYVPCWKHIRKFNFLLTIHETIHQRKKDFAKLISGLWKYRTRFMALIMSSRMLGCWPVKPRATYRKRVREEMTNTLHVGNSEMFRPRNFWHNSSIMCNLQINITSEQMRCEDHSRRELKKNGQL